MIERLLELMQTGGAWRVDDLARALDTTPGLVRVMLEDLARRGYLHAPTNACDAKCSGCALAGNCTDGAPATGILWTMTEKVP